MKYLILVDGVFYLRNDLDPHHGGGWFLEDVTRIIAEHPGSKFQIYPANR